MGEAWSRDAMLVSSSLVRARSRSLAEGATYAADRGGLMADQMVANETGETEVPGEGAILTTDIDMGFAPQPIDDVTVLAIGDELVLYHAAG